MANETEKTILPYLNVLEVETIDKSNVTKVIVIDKDDEVKVMDGSQLATNSYFDLQDKPEINSIELNGNMTSEELGLASSEDIVTMENKERIEVIKRNINKKEEMSYVSREGGSGFYKIEKIITVDLNCPLTMNFDYSKDKFIVELDIESRGVFYEDINNWGR